MFSGQVDSVWRRMFSFGLMLLTPIWLPQILCATQNVNCVTDVSLQNPHDYYEPGDIIIGGIASQHLVLWEWENFTVLPKNWFLNHPM